MANKFTLASLKSFIRKNSDRLMIKCSSSFDGMTDCVQQDRNATFVKITKTDLCPSRTLGIQGVWVVGSSRDYFQVVYDASGTPIQVEVNNCCGSFTLKV